MTELAPTGGFDAVVWHVKADSMTACPNNENAGQTFVSMRGTQGAADIADEPNFGHTGVPTNQIVSMVKWWRRMTTPNTRLLGSRAHVAHTSTFNSAHIAPGSEGVFAELQNLIGPAYGLGRFPNTGSSPTTVPRKTSTLPLTTGALSR